MNITIKTKQGLVSLNSVPYKSFHLSHNILFTERIKLMDHFLSGSLELPIAIPVQGP